ncbi:hypothetical protein [Phaeobacter sp. S60]|uniref:hypothetical protein n=1 Tax=Phaeobacter sp. S60 TaxID=1569353 RepID=UPI00058FD398|nr:hypothetical protein [Phaeobacter sp. S60]KII14886.1 hypothetical protein OO25_10950 [Phaeobacter sp. S60]
MADQITYDDFLRLLRDDDVSDTDLRPYVELVPGDGGLDFNVRPNPKTVAMTAADQELESAMKIGNGLARFRRRGKFFSVLEREPDKPVIVSEGDSWFQFPILIDETIDHLLPDFNVWSLGAAGATLKEMTTGSPQKGKFEFITELRRHRARVKAFLFSGAGNDIIGEDPATKEPMLLGLLNDFNGNVTDVSGHINFSVLNDRISELRLGYSRMIGLVRSEPGLERLPVIIHGYDYAIPYPASASDKRNPIYAGNDQWLGRAFAKREINDAELRRKIIAVFIDRLYNMLFALSDEQGQNDVHVVDCRGSMPNVDDWNDEIHGTSKGFEEVGKRFNAVLDGVLIEATS